MSEGNSMGSSTYRPGEPPVLFDHTPNEVRVGCMCAGACTVALVTSWDADEDAPAQTSVELYEHINAQPKVRDRVRVAWAVLRGREPYTHGLILNAEDARALGDFLVRKTHPNRAQK